MCIRLNEENETFMQMEEAVYMKHGMQVTS